MPVVSRKAALTLDFLVVGGGVGGLAVAYMLQNAGHRVRVLEKRDYSVPSSGHRIPPNMSKILKQWVGEEELRRVSIRNIGTPFKRLRTDEDIGYLPWKPAVLAETGGEFLTMHHDDLIDMLHKLATEVGVQVTTDAKVVSVQQGSEEMPNPSVTLANGDVLYADVLIGADGAKSLVRDVVLEEEDDPEPGSLTVYTGLIEDTSEMLQDPDLRPLVYAEAWQLWMGEHRCFCAHALRQRKQFFFGIYSWRNLDGLKQGGEEDWEEIWPKDKVLVEQDGPTLRKLVSMVPHLIRTQYKTRKNDVPEWVDATGRIVLLGDAAHPGYPGGSHTSSMAVEDAVVLGSLFSHLRTMSQVTSFLNAYQELRQRRCEMVRQADIGNAHLMVLPAGPEATARDENMRRAMGDWDDGMLKAQFEEFAEIFGYDAGDDAEEWWVSWGRFSETAREQPNMMHYDFGHSSVTVHSD